MFMIVFPQKRWYRMAILIASVAIGASLFLIPACLKSFTAQRGAKPALLPERVFQTEGVTQCLAVSRDDIVVLGSGRLMDLTGNANKPREPPNNIGISTFCGCGASSSGETLVVGDGRGLFQVWGCVPIRLRMNISVGGFPRPTVLLPDECHFFYVGKDQDNYVIRRIDTKTGAVADVFGPGCRVSAAIKWGFDPIGPLAVASGGNDLVIGVWKGVVVWNLNEHRERFTCPLSEETTCHIAAVSADGKEMATVANNLVKVWDFVTGKRLAEPPPFVGGNVTQVAFSPDGKLLAAHVFTGVHKPSYVKVWRRDDYSQGQAFQCHDSRPRAMSFVPGTNKLVTAGDDKTVKLWNLDKLRWRMVKNSDERRSPAGD